MLGKNKSFFNIKNMSLGLIILTLGNQIQADIFDDVKTANYASFSTEYKQQSNFTVTNATGQSPLIAAVLASYLASPTSTTPINIQKNANVNTCPSNWDIYYIINNILSGYVTASSVGANTNWFLPKPLISLQTDSSGYTAFMYAAKSNNTLITSSDTKDYTACGEDEGYNTQINVAILNAFLQRPDVTSFFTTPNVKDGDKRAIDYAIEYANTSGDRSTLETLCQACAPKLGLACLDVNGNDPCNCPASQPIWNGSKCVSCPASQPAWSGSECISCPASQPIWDGSKCVSCLHDSDCPSPWRCNTSINVNICVRCLSNNDCEGALCDPTTYKCVPCLQDSDCNTWCSLNEGCTSCSCVNNSCSLTDDSTENCDVGDGLGAVSKKNTVAVKSNMMGAVKAPVVPVTPAVAKSKVATKKNKKAKIVSGSKVAAK